jgi:hypothetical protein
MNYWTVYTRRYGKRLYVAGTDEYGYPLYTENEKEAWKFRCFETAKNYLDYGCVIIRH